MPTEEEMKNALRVFAKTSMSEVRPTRREYHIGWQDVDGQYGPKEADIRAALAVARSV